MYTSVAIKMFMSMSSACQSNNKIVANETTRRSPNFDLVNKFFCQCLAVAFKCCTAFLFFFYI